MCFRHLSFCFHGFSIHIFCPFLIFSFLFSFWCLTSFTQSHLTLCDPMDCSVPGFPVHHQLQELAQTHVHRVSDAIQLSHPLLSPSPPAFNLSQHQSLFQWANSSHQVAKVLEFQLQHQSFQWIFRTGIPLGFTGWISLQESSSRAFSNTTFQKQWMLPCSAFFIVQLSHPYMTTGKTIALTRHTFVASVMSLLFNMLSRLVIGFLPRSKCLLISWLQSPSAVILEPPKMSVSFHYFPFY